MPMIESWKFELRCAASVIVVSGENTPATRIRVEVQEPDGCQPGDDAPAPRAGMWITANDWREMAAAVAKKLSPPPSPLELAALAEAAKIAAGQR